MIKQTVLFTIMPRGVTLGAGPLPVSVIVSPRLMGSNRLGDFPDWLSWTHILKERGLTLGLRCGTRRHRVRIDQDVLEPRLWEQLFNEETLVRSYEYNDYSERGIISYPMRESLSAIKRIYQEAGVELALPADPGQEERDSNRRLLAEMVDGLDVHWNGEAAPRWRSVIRKMNSAGREGIRRREAGSLDSEGLIIAPRNAADSKKAALPFAVFHHMPTPREEEAPLEIDTDNVLDFHQAISSLNSYPALLRALGLVFDLELPLNFVAETDPGQFGTLAVTRTTMDWKIDTDTVEQETAYVNLATGQNHLFVTAPRVLEDATTPLTAVGLIDLDPARFGLTQVDVDGAMHKTTILSDTLNDPDPEHNIDPYARPEPAPHPEIYDRDATLPALRSGGISLYADQLGMQLLDSMLQSKDFNDALENSGTQSRPFFAEDLLRGYRIDVWDSHTAEWHSLHRRIGTYKIGDEGFEPGEEEGFVQTAAMQPAPGAAEGPDGEDLYLHETIARWAGWSLSVPMPGKHLSRYGDPDKAVPPDSDPTGEYREDQPDTPFKMTVNYEIVEGSLPRLVFGRRYRLRARAVDLAGNSLAHNAPLAAMLSLFWALPRLSAGQSYLRYEPVNAPLVVIRDAEAVTGPGSAVNRLVIRSFNEGIEQDGVAADTSAGDRHLLPPRTSVEMGEQLGMFDDAAGKLKPDAATWQLIVDRDAGELNQQQISIAGTEPRDHPLEAAESIKNIPYLPDPLAAGAALRDLPGTPDKSLGKDEAQGGGQGPVVYDVLDDPNPRSGSATLISFGNGDWQNRAGIRLALAEPQAEQDDLRPRWNPAKRVLTVFLPKGETAIVPLSSYMTPRGIKLMGQWEWLRQYIEFITVLNPQPHYLLPGAAVDKVNHILQRAVEGGHWMLNPPLLLTLVHAVQQPLGRPGFTALNVDHDDDVSAADPLQTARVRGQQDPAELAPITAWRRPGSTVAFLLGALQVHGASSAQIDLHAEWSEPIDDASQPAWQFVERTAHVETIPLADLNEGYLQAPELDYRLVGYYDRENDQIAFTRYGDRGGPLAKEYSTTFFYDAAPRQQFNDTRRRKIKYRAVASSRYREYFPSDVAREEAGLERLDFTRRSEPVVVDVPASERPLAPDVAYVLPTFGWQRQTDTNIKRSVRFGGGLRVYLRRPWFSSGEGELLGVTLWSGSNGLLNEANRDKFKSYFTQWGMDPIWQTADLDFAPSTYHFTDSVATNYSASLEERVDPEAKEPARMNVVGFPAAYDAERQLWFSDLTIRTDDDTYMPFIRLALVRYQPHALEDALISRVVLADFAQIAPDRSVLITVDPQTPRQLRVVVSGIAPSGPQAIVKGEPQPQEIADRPTKIRVRVQANDGRFESDLAWRDVDDSQKIQVAALYDGAYPGQADLGMWAGTVTFAPDIPRARYRLLIEEHEYISADYTIGRGPEVEQPGRLIFAETVELDEVLLPRDLIT